MEERFGRNCVTLMKPWGGLAVKSYSGLFKISRIAIVNKNGHQMTKLHDHRIASHENSGREITFRNGTN